MTINAEPMAKAFIPLVKPTVSTKKNVPINSVMYLFITVGFVEAVDPDRKVKNIPAQPYEQGQQD